MQLQELHNYIYAIARVTHWYAITRVTFFTLVIKVTYLHAFTY